MCMCVEMMTRDRKCPEDEACECVCVCVYCKLPRGLPGPAGLTLLQFLMLVLT